jgi:hypothetical protein
MLQALIRRLIGEFTEGLEHDIERRVDRVLRRAPKNLVLAGVGITFLAAGSIFVLIGAVSYLSLFVLSSYAWGLVGLIITLVGAISLLLVRR